jgi:hypothetical protein
MTQADFLDHDFPAIRPLKLHWPARIQPLAKDSNYFNSFIQKNFIIHFKDSSKVS